MDRSEAERNTGIINPLENYRNLWTSTTTVPLIDIEENGNCFQNGKETRHVPLDNAAAYDRVQQSHDCYDSDSSCKQRRSVSSGDGSDLPLLNSTEQLGILSLKDFDHCHVEEVHTNSAAKLQLSIACLLCLIFMVAEIIGGYFAGSTAVMTDAAHMLSDFVGLFVSLCAMWISGHKPTRRLTFGYYRVEVLGALLSVSVIWVLTAVFVFVAVQRIVGGIYEIHSNAMMLVSIFGIFVNIVMAIILASGSCLKGHDRHHHHPNNYHHGHKHGDEMNINLRAAVIHVIGDLLQSIGVFIAACIVTFFPEAKIADPICTFIFAPIVIVTTLRVLRDTTWVLLEACPMHLDYSTIARDLCMLDGVEAIHGLNIWALTPGHYVLTVHLTVDASTDRDVILDRSHRLLRAKYNLNHTTIQVEKFLPDIMDKCPQCQLPNE